MGTMQRSATSAADRAEIRRILNQDPAWAAYGLADLQPAFAPHCQWYTTTGNGAEGVVLLFTALTPPILLTVGPPAVVAALLAEMHGANGLPERVFISARHEHVPPIEHYYRFDLPARGTSFHRMVRMVLRHPTALPDARLEQVHRLAPVDARRIQQLFTHGGAYTPDAFEPYQLEEGIFYGLDNANGELVAVGGTHIVDWQAGIAAIGNMYTHPAHRGQGHGRLILGAVVHSLRNRGIEKLVLNVNEKNATARRLYAHAGFDEHCDFAEGIGVRAVA